MHIEDLGDSPSHMFSILSRIASFPFYFESICPGVIICHCVAWEKAYFVLSDVPTVATDRPKANTPVLRLSEDNGHLFSYVRPLSVNETRYLQPWS